MKVTISESCKENKKINTRQSTLEKKKPSTPVHKTNLKLKKENNVMNYSTNNTKKSTSGKSMDVIHDMKMGLKKSTTDRRDINLKTIKIEEDIKKRREKEKLKEEKMKKEKKEEKSLREKAIKDKALKDKIMKERLSKEKKEKGNKKSIKEASPNKEKQSKKVFTNVTVKKTEMKKEDAKIENVKQVQVELDLQLNEEKKKFRKKTQNNFLI